MYMRREKKTIVSALASTYALIGVVGTLEYVYPEEMGGPAGEQTIRTLAVNDMVVNLEAVADALETELTR